jgi:hypothetical protein
MATLEVVTQDLMTTEEIEYLARGRRRYLNDGVARVVVLAVGTYVYLVVNRNPYPLPVISGVIVSLALGLAIYRIITTRKIKRTVAAPAGAPAARRQRPRSSCHALSVQIATGTYALDRLLRQRVDKATPATRAATFFVQFSTAEVQNCYQKVARGPEPESPLSQTEAAVDQLHSTGHIGRLITR